MHLADQYEAFPRLHDEEGMAAADIAARFGVTPAIVKQHLKLGAVSPKLIEAYRRGELSLEELTAFTIADDHARQEQVWEELPEYSRSRRAILKGAFRRAGIKRRPPRSLYRSRRVPRGGRGVFRNRRLAPAAATTHTAVQPVLTFRKFCDAAADRAWCKSRRRRYRSDFTMSGRHSLRSRHQPSSPFIKERRRRLKPLANQTLVDHISRL